MAAPGAADIRLLLGVLSGGEAIKELAGLSCCGEMEARRELLAADGAALLECRRDVEVVGKRLATDS